MPLFRRRDRQPTSVSYGNITGSTVATGDNNQQYLGSPVTTPPPDPAGLEAAIAALRAAVEQQAAAGKPRTQALAQVDAIATAASKTPPDGKRLTAAADWIKAALPNAAPAIARVIEHPTLDTVVSAAAQAIHDTAAHPPRAESSNAAHTEPDDDAQD